MGPVIENIVGFTAAVISFIIWLPQARSTWRYRNDPAALAVASLGTQLLVLLNATVWWVYAIGTEAYWSGAPGAVNLPLALLSIALILRARRAEAAGVACGCGEVGEHQFFVSAPPGFGVVRQCHGSRAGGFPVPVGTRYDRASRTLIFPEAAPATPAT